MRILEPIEKECIICYNKFYARQHNRETCSEKCRYRQKVLYKGYLQQKQDNYRKDRKKYSLISKKWRDKKK